MARYTASSLLANGAPRTPKPETYCLPDPKPAHAGFFGVPGQEVERPGTRAWISENPLASTKEKQTLNFCGQCGARLESTPMFHLSTEPSLGTAVHHSATGTGDPDGDTGEAANHHRERAILRDSPVQFGCLSQARPAGVARTDYWLSDLGSKNGISVVNGQVDSKHEAQP